MKLSKSNYSTKSQITMEFFMIMSILFFVFIMVVFLLNEYVYSDSLTYEGKSSYEDFNNLIELIRISNNYVEYEYDFLTKYGLTTINLTDGGDRSFVKINGTAFNSEGYITKMNNDNPSLIFNNKVLIIKNNSGLYLEQG